jgi:hypothetical protein
MDQAAGGQYGTEDVPPPTPLSSSKNAGPSARRSRARSTPSRVYRAAVSSRRSIDTTVAVGSGSAVAVARMSAPSFSAQLSLARPWHHGRVVAGAGEDLSRLELGQHPRQQRCPPVVPAADLDPTDPERGVCLTEQPRGLRDRCFVGAVGRESRSIDGAPPAGSPGRSTALRRPRAARRGPGTRHRPHRPSSGIASDRSLRPEPFTPLLGVRPEVRRCLSRS